MFRFARIVSLAAVVGILWPLAARAQFPSELVGFNGPPIDDPATSQEMFRIPEWSGSTAGYVVHNVTGYESNAAFRAAGLHTEGAAAMQVFFYWVDTNDPDAWVRLTTFDGPERPNPALHTEGKVRFKVTNRSELVNGEIGICLGIRETGVEVPQMANGGTAGDIEWVGVDTTPNGITAGPDGIVDTEADPESDDVQEYPVGYDIINDPNEPLPTGTAVVSPGPDGVLQTTPTPDDEVRFGYYIAANGARRPIPAITLPPAPTAYQLEWNLSTGAVTIDGSPVTGGIAGFTGDGNLDVAPPRGVLEHIAFTNLSDDPAVLIDFAIDELQFEAPEADPVLAPTVVWPIIAGDLEVTVTDLQFSVDQVNLQLNGDPYLSQAVTTTDDVVFTLPAAAETGQAYTATQVVNGVESAPSAPVIVLPEPPPYTFSLLVDEGGTGSCDYDTGWEWVGVTDVEIVSGKWAPQGQPVFTNDGYWQAIDVPLDDDSLVMAGSGGNGTLDPSPTGFYTIDSIWFTLAEEGALGPWVVFIDSVQVIDEFGQPGEVILDMEDGVNRLGRPRGQSPDELNLISSALSTLASYDGATCHRLEWEYDGIPLESIGMLQREGYTCGTSALVPDTSTAIRFQLVLRAQPTAPDIDLPEVVAPIVVGTQDTVRILNHADATSVQLYLNGEPEGAPATPSGTETDFGGLSLEPGDSISATQTLPAGVSDLAYPRAVLDAPPPPTVVAPIFPGDTAVTVTDVLVVAHATAEYVIVYADGEWVGFATAGTETVVVNVTEVPGLEEGQEITATQYVNGVESAHSDPVVVGIPGPTLYKAPAEGDTIVTVLGVHPDATSLTVWVNGGMSSFEVDPGGATTVDVPVSGLVMGDTVTAWMVVDGNSSGQSDYEIVTTSTPVEIFCDDFEYEQADYEAAWGTVGTYLRLELVDTKNATPGGEKSLYAQEGDTRVDKQIAPLIPTETEPVIVNFDIYDEIGVGNAAVQFVQLTGDLDAGDWFLLEPGILGWANTDNVHYDLRIHGNGGSDWLDLDEFDAPDRSVGWHNITVVHKGLRIDAYVDGLLALKNSPMTDPTTYEFAKIGAAPYSEGTAYFDDYCVEVGPVRFGEVPPNPAIAAPIEDGDQLVTVTGARDDATLVQIRDEGAIVIGTYAGVMDPAGVDIPLIRPLVHLESITAEMTTPDWGVTSSSPLEVGKGNGDILICIGVRETDDAGPLGSEGSSTGTIEWIGADSVVDDAPQGIAVSLSDSWQPLVFDPVAGPVTGFSGDGVIDVARGTLEHLAVAVNAASPDRSTGAYELYVDNVVNVGAGDGGSDFVITDFEGFEVGTEVLFQEPTYSGSTDMHLAPLPSASEVSDAAGNPGQSELLVWFWVSTDAQRWARITTSGAAEVPSPIIDLTKPIQMDVLLVAAAAGCPNPGDSGNYCTADIDGSGDCIVGLADLAQLLGHYGTTSGAEHDDGDLDGDGDVDLSDLAALLGQYGDDCN